MRKISVSNLNGNEILARPIYLGIDTVLLGKGIILKKNYIQKLKELGIEYLYIEDEISQGIEINDYIKEQTRISGKEAVRKIIDKYSTSGKVDLDNIGLITTRIIDEILENKEVIVNLSDIRSKDEYNYAHNVNVCCLAVLTAVRLGISDDKIKEIAIGAILHDLGKARIPKDIIDRQEQLSEREYEVYKQHVTLGYEAVKEKKWLSSLSKVIILTHHERINGSGFPYGWTEEKIHEAVKIVSICDVFDTMTNKRLERDAYKTYEVIEYLMAMKGSLFDAQIVDVFINLIALYPSGSGIITNKNDYGIVVKQNQGLSTRPIIRLLKNINGDSYPPNMEIDLSKEHTVFIVDTYEI